MDRFGGAGAYEVWAIDRETERAKQLRTETCGTCGHCQLPDADLMRGDLAYCTHWGEFVRANCHPVEYDCEEYCE